jgi:acetyltransferase-like isoleucine patch superfamily enzyme
MRVQQLYWRWRDETQALALWYLGQIPLAVGIWLRSRTLRHFLRAFGDHTDIADNFRLRNAQMISIGHHCNFGESVSINGGGGVTIGNYVGFGPGVKIWSVNHRYENPDIPWFEQGYEKAPVVIEDDVWLAANCFVMPGVTVGRGAIVSAGTVLMKSVPPFAIVAGNPGRVVGWRKRPEALATKPGEATMATTTEG